MRPWTIDADDIQVADDFDAKLLHRTSWIDDFLGQTREEKFIVTATKGFGKTLLLKAKRVTYQDTRGVLCLPENCLLDKPVGDKVFSAEMIELFGRASDNWRKVWLISIAAAVLKQLGLLRGLSVNPRLAALLADEDLRSVLDHFVNVLDFPRGDLFKSASDTDNHLVPRLRNVSTAVAVFIDSIDEYFNKHIMTMASRPSDAGQLSVGVWYFSQMALVETAYQLRRVNHHIKVYAAVRKEAFSRLEEATPMAQQYRGSMIDISYSMDSLRQIFINNIRKEKERNLVFTSRLRDRPVEAFLGVAHVTHAYTGQQEEVFDYIYRHTLRRPRDLMTIGRKLSDMSPAERNEHTIKSAVNRGATEIAREYLNEISPYVRLVRLDALFAKLPGNVLTRADVERVFRMHNDELRAAGELVGDRDQHVFCTLFKAGLLGYVAADLVSARRVQCFLMPGERTFDPDGVLPQSSHYLLHPVLAEIITRANQPYAQHIDRLNVVGDGRPWREPDEEQSLCVLRADIQALSRYMDESTLDHELRAALRELVETHAGQCRMAEITGGDSLTLVHHDPNSIVKIAKRIMEDLFDVVGNPVLRVAIDYGNVRLAPRADGAPPRTSGAPFRTAARLEPLVTPNDIWVTGPFKEALERTPAFFEAAAIPESEQHGEHWSNGRLNIKKRGSGEADRWVAVYRIIERRVRRDG